MIVFCCVFDRLFVIRDGNLMLFEKLGDEQPILKLHHSDCVTHADARNREFVITHKVSRESLASW